MNLIRTRQLGFTLVELLTVIAIVGILTAILIPTTSSARISARRAKTKVVFSQWASAMELFRQEYGFYPAIDGGTGKIDSGLFAAALTGRSLNGSSADTNQLLGNSRRISFYAITESELNETRTALVDAFGNTEIAVLYDSNGDGLITSADGAANAVNGFAPSLSDLDLSAGIRARVIFYSAGNGANAGDLVFSWK